MDGGTYSIREYSYPIIDGNIIATNILLTEMYDFFILQIQKKDKDS